MSKKTAPVTIIFPNTIQKTSNRKVIKNLKEKDLPSVREDPLRTREFLDEKGSLGW